MVHFWKVERVLVLWTDAAVAVGGAVEDEVHEGQGDVGECAVLGGDLDGAEFFECELFDFVDGEEWIVWD